MIRLDEFLAATSGHIVSTPGPVDSRVFPDFAYDSRIVAPGELFLAVVTETGDGHDYLLDACRAGAAGLVGQRFPADLPTGIICIHVENTQAALADYARYILAHRSIEVVGITGSVGKTSTKEAVAAVLATRYPVFRNFGSYNGRYGLPIALGRLGEGERLAVLEMACDALDEIGALAEITHPRVGVVTSVSASHLEYLGTLEAIAREKGRLVEALPAGGAAVLNADDPRVRAMAGRTAARVLTYGRAASADLRLLDVRLDLYPPAPIHHPAEYVREMGSWVQPAGGWTTGGFTTIDALWGTERVTLRLPLLGAHHAYTALAAAAVGRVYGLGWDEIIEGLERVEPLPGRTRLLAGVKGSLLLDDSYNASPASARAALETLRALPARRRLVVLGDMAQLGDEAEPAHRALGRACAEVADLLVTKGELARLAAEEALRAGMAPAAVRVTDTPADALGALGPLAAGDLVLLKGSAAARLELVTRELLAAPEIAPEVLPRQTRGWAQVRLERPGRPTWVEVDLAAVAHNTRRLSEIVGPGVELLAVLKADGYGHGATRVARTVLSHGASWLGVACLSEAVTLREAGITAPILILGYTPAWQAREAVLHDVTVAVFAQPVAEALSQAALALGRTARAHVKLDTGMGRLGLAPDEALPFFRSIQGLPGLDVDGVFTHMAAADDEDLGYTEWQLDQFDAVLAALRAESLLPRRIHAANSACLLRLPRARYNLVRPGIALYGLNPSPAARLPADFRPALSFKCQVAQVKELPTGSYVSYGRTFRTARPSRIAVIPVGYADGFRRAPAHWGTVLVRGQRAPIVGRVCMDQTMLDVTDIPGVRQGDEVVLIGRQGDGEITVDEVAARLGTINYEVVSEILARVPRVV